MSQFNQRNQQVNDQQNAGRDIIITNIRHHPWIAILLIIVLVVGAIAAWYIIIPPPPPAPINLLTPTPSANPWTIIPGSYTHTQQYYSGRRALEGMHYLNIGVMFRNTSSKEQLLNPNSLELVYKTSEVYKEVDYPRNSFLVSAGSSSPYIGVDFEVPDTEGCFILTMSDGSGGRIGNWNIGDQC